MVGSLLFDVLVPRDRAWKCCQHFAGTPGQIEHEFSSQCQTIVIVIHQEINRMNRYNRI
ncbi:hypothetical protein BCR43DRAFT_496265 [Syncephalastrum racemosum]|uniref:Uncharacterized protein n=1 Tax=Syncephalastrum racemosum TaxID=13706 RepID=A0A1X2H3S2_SYNRA|nr:hypothetical protein BCR43DRAFT_496265 [Syncephalastrum racemosum]